MSFDIQSKGEPLPETSSEKDDWWEDEPVWPRENDSFERTAAAHTPHVPSSTLRREKKSRKTRLWLFSVFCIAVLVSGGWWIKEKVVSEGLAGGKELQAGVAAFKAGENQGGRDHFQNAALHFQSANIFFTGWGNILSLLHALPGLSKIATGYELLETGEALARAGLSLSDVVTKALTTLSGNDEEGVLVRTLAEVQAPLSQTEGALEEANTHFQSVRLSDVPDEQRETIGKLQNELPSLLATLKLSLEHASLLNELLGGKGPRQYLFLFENNQELRATGGFIGSYALLDLTGGGVRKFIVDGIFNPDGQLKENIVPPQPIQKISAAWSLHDSNWFPDFPTSAEKAISFFEKTGGPTVDGVIVITPLVLQRLLAITGPITLPQYGVTIDENNVLEIVQEQVEVKYDKTENAPKKILSDLAGALLERLLAHPNAKDIRALGKALTQSLNERHVLLYARSTETEELIDAAGWSGRVLSTPHDYLSVIHTNINGYKTDGVISESIVHHSTIAPDGSITDTVSITRKHNGGHTPYEWWNKVNADYLRVYVPLGSTLLSARGMTREVVPEPLDYTALGFHRDPDVVREEGAITIDPESGTRIGVDAGKTVFGNWVYVSPGESVTVEYEYRLREKLPLSSRHPGEGIGYSVLYQKQAGTKGIDLSGSVTAPEGLTDVWQSGENLLTFGRTETFHTSFDLNQFVAFVWKKE